LPARVFGQYSPVYTFLAKGKMPVKADRNYYERLRDLITEADPGRQREVDIMIRAAIQAQRGWDQPIPDLPRPVKELLDCLRKAVIARFAGHLPKYEGDRLYASSLIHRFLETGELPKAHFVKLSLREFYDQLQKIIAEDDPGKQIEVERKFRAAI